MELLKVLGVTHVVNAADGPSRIHTGAAFYSDAHIQIRYYGVEAPDSRDFNISRFFYPTAHFIHSALTLSCKSTEHTLTYSHTPLPTHCTGDRAEGSFGLEVREPAL